MTIYNLTENEFDEKTKDGIVLLDFYADWCGPCKRLNPILEKISEENKDINIFKINVDKENNLAAKFKIRNIPLIIIYNNGQQVLSLPGLNSYEKIMSEISSIKNMWSMHVIKTEHYEMTFPADKLAEVLEYIESLREAGIKFEHYFIE